MYQIHNCSPQMSKHLDKEATLYEPINSQAAVDSKAQKYPFKKMGVGHCFIVGNDDKEVSAARKAASMANKVEAPKFFKVMKHEDCTEIARIK